MTSEKRRVSNRNARMRNPKYYRNWMRAWRANPENKGHERALEKLRRWARAGTVPQEMYEAELWRKPHALR